MEITTIYAIGSALVLIPAGAAVAYLRKPLFDILVEVCGNERRAGFWTAYSNVMLIAVPLLGLATSQVIPGEPAYAGVKCLVLHGTAAGVATLAMLCVVFAGVIRWNPEPARRRRPAVLG